MSNLKVWVTGAGSGIGRALAMAYAAQGASLILSGRNMTNLTETAALAKGNQGTEIIQLDLADHDAIESTYNTHTDSLRDVDILINNAGISQRSLTAETEFKVYKRLIDVNFLGTVQLSLLMLKDFKRKGSGHFVNISSVAGKFGVPLRSGYCASKFALHGFFESLRAETKEANIHITMVCPGFIRTDISKNALKADGIKHGTMDQAQENGMSAEIMASKVLKAIESKKAEFYVGGFKETSMAVWMSRVFPSIFRKIIANTSVT